MNTAHSQLCPRPRYMQLVDPVRMIFKWIHPTKEDLNGKLGKHGKVGSPKKAKKVLKDDPYLPGIV